MSPDGFGGCRLHVVQVGLGTNATFIQNLAGAPEEWDNTIAWLLETISESRPNLIKGVGVEPVEDRAVALRRVADRLPHASVVQAAVGEKNATSESLHVLTQRDYDSLLKHACPRQHEQLKYQLDYLMNMSCVGCEHPEFEARRQHLLSKYGVEVNLQLMCTDVWSWERLSHRMNFNGCELLIVDAEGHDAMVLRSMIAHCEEMQRKALDIWPDVIQFETMSHCDALEGVGTEWGVIDMLMNCGYVLLHFSWSNSHLIRATALHTEERLRRWANDFVCSACQSSGAFPYSSDYQGYWCWRCTCSWNKHRNWQDCCWRRGAGDRKAAGKHRRRTGSKRQAWQRPPVGASVR